MSADRKLTLTVVTLDDKGRERDATRIEFTTEQRALAYQRGIERIARRMKSRVRRKFTLTGAAGGVPA